MSTEQSDLTYKSGTTLHSECDCCEHAAKRLAEIEAELAEIKASTRRMSFENEWYLEGLRNPPGDYVLMRVGPATPDETPF
jgi:hypothetical protein